MWHIIKWMESGKKDKTLIYWDLKKIKRMPDKKML